MSTLTKLSQWQALITHQQEIAHVHMRDLFQADTQRFKKFSIDAVNLLFDYSKNRITSKTLELLCQLAETLNLADKIDAMFKGALINTTENRPALHVALRNFTKQPILVNGHDIMPTISETLAKMASFTEQIHRGIWRGYTNKPITDIVNMGIGGSDRGPVMVTHALTPFAETQLRLHFVSNIDGTHIAQTLKKLNPETSLFIISSKSFTTQETLVNAQTARAWFIENTGNTVADNKHFVAITSKPQLAIAFGIAAENIFPIWDWVGGRYSLWSAVGLPIALAIGMQNFTELLAGAYSMDQHFHSAPFTRNIPVILGLLGIWYTNFFGANAQAILPYDHLLQYLPLYLQQLTMESSGKYTKHDGNRVDYHTGQIIFGEPGTNGQHAFYQFLHQGTQLIPADFIMPVHSHNPIGQHHAILFANALSQSKALMEGKTVEEITAEMRIAGYTEIEIKRLAPHKFLSGNRPSNTLLFEKLTPAVLGSLIALYEHKIFVQSIIWQINAFDQWGVERGKQLTDIILPRLVNDTAAEFTEDSSTNGLMGYYLRHLSNKC